jgi:phosphoglycerate dehydrogenase-like enzyme
MTPEAIRVVVSGDLPSSFPTTVFDNRIQLISAHTDEELRNAAREAEVMFTWRVPNEGPAKTPPLRWIRLVSAGADHKGSFGLRNSVP